MNGSGHPIHFVISKIIGLAVSINHTKGMIIYELHLTTKHILISARCKLGVRFSYYRKKQYQLNNQDASLSFLSISNEKAYLELTFPALRIFSLLKKTFKRCRHFVEGKNLENTFLRALRIINIYLHIYNLKQEKAFLILDFFVSEVSEKNNGSSITAGSKNTLWNCEGIKNSVTNQPLKLKNQWFSVLLFQQANMLSHIDVRFCNRLRICRSIVCSFTYQFILR
jgi:hypothetical protein